MVKLSFKKIVHLDTITKNLAITRHRSLARMFNEYRVASYDCESQTIAFILSKVNVANAIITTLLTVLPFKSSDYLQRSYLEIFQTAESTIRFQISKGADRK
jgi:hypothetical protein